MHETATSISSPAPAPASPRKITWPVVTAAVATTVLLAVVARALGLSEGLTVAAALLQSAAAALLPWALLGLVAEVVDLVAIHRANRGGHDG